MSSYTLWTAAGGARLERAQEGGTDRCNRTMEGGRYELVCQHIQIATLTNALAVMLRGPVGDQTGLTGDYDFALSWDGDDIYSAVPDAMEVPPIRHFAPFTTGQGRLTIARRMPSCPTIQCQILRET